MNGFFAIQGRRQIMSELQCFFRQSVTWERVSHLRQKAPHALFSLRRNTDFKSMKPSLACKIFDSMISPILTYNSEVWGTFFKSDFKSWDNSPIEKAHLRFCKRYLEVHNKTSNMASRAELNKYSMIELYNSGQNSFYSN